MKKDSKDFFSYILYGIISLQIITIIIFNLTQGYQEITYDSSSTLLQAIEIWEHKSIFLEEWGYQTSLLIDTPVVLAAILYGITKNIYMSYGIANILIMILIIYLVNNIIKKANLSLQAKYIVTILILSPYTIGMLGYLPMLFTGHAPYSLKLVMLLMLFNIMLSFNEITQTGKCKIVKVVKVVFLILSFIAGLSTGIYMLICAIVPFFMYEFVNVLVKGEHKGLINKKIIYLISSIVCIISGYLIAKIIGVTSTADSMTLINVGNFWDNLQKAFVGIFELFGALPYEHTTVLSISGIIYILKFIIVIILLSTIGYFTIKICKMKKEDYIINNIIIIFFINEIVLLLTNSTYGTEYFEYRYHILGIFLTFILIGYIYDEIIKKSNSMVKIFGLTCFISGMIIINIYGYTQYFKGNNNTKELKGVINVINKYDPKVVICIGKDNFVESRILRAFDTDRNFILSEDGRVPDSWGSDKELFDNHMQGNKIIVLSNDQEYELLPNYIKNNLVYEETVYKYNIYSTINNKLDFSSQYPTKENDKRVDFPYTGGYILSLGVMNENGEYITEGKEGFVLYGPYTEQPRGVYDIKLNYEVIESKNEVGYFDVTTKGGTEILASTMIDASETSVVLENVEIQIEESIEHRVYINEGNWIKIKSIEVINKGEILND